MFVHYSNPNSKNRVTIVGSHQNGVLNLAASRCSSKDSFIRKKGRAIAEERLANNNLIASLSYNDCSAKKFHLIAKHISKIIEEDATIINKK